MSRKPIHKAPKGRIIPKAATPLIGHRRPGEMHSDDVKTEAMSDIGDQNAFAGDTIETADTMPSNDQAAKLMFNEEPVTIMLTPSDAENAVPYYPTWCNGKGTEILINGRWIEATYVPVGIEFTTKRKYVGILAGAKQMRPKTVVTGGPYGGGFEASNRLERPVVQTVPFQVIEDANPRGRDWLKEVLRRAA